MSHSTDSQLHALADIIKNETNRHANSANRIGSMLKAIIFSKLNTTDITGIIVTPILIADLEILAVTSSLVPNGKYLITDRCHRGMIVDAIDTKSFSTIALGGYLNCDFTSVGNYDGVFNVTEVPFAANKGVWREADKSSLVLGDVVIWNCQHFQVTNAADVLSTDPPNINTATYTLLDRLNPNVGYVETWDILEYDVINDYLLFRYDRYGNKINGGSIPSFDWGNFRIQNVVQNGTTTTISMINCWSMSIISGVDNSMWSFIDFDENHGFTNFNLNGTNQSIVCTNNSGTIELNINGISIGAQGNNNTGTVRSYLYNQSLIQFHNNSGTISSRHYDSSVANFSSNSGNILNAEVAKEISLALALDEGVIHEACKYAYAETFTLPNDKNYANKELSNVSSTFDIDLDLDVVITGDGEIVIPDYVGKVNLINTNLAGGDIVIKYINKQTTFDILFTKSCANAVVFFNDTSPNELSRLNNTVNKKGDRKLTTSGVDYIKYSYFSAIQKYMESDYKFYSAYPAYPAYKKVQSLPYQITYDDYLISVNNDVTDGTVILPTNIPMGLFPVFVIKRFSITDNADILIDGGSGGIQNPYNGEVASNTLYLDYFDGPYWSLVFTWNGFFWEVFH